MWREGEVLALYMASEASHQGGLSAAQAGLAAGSFIPFTSASIRGQRIDCRLLLLFGIHGSVHFQETGQLVWLTKCPSHHSHTDSAECTKAHLDADKLSRANPQFGQARIHWQQHPLNNAHL